MEERPAISCGAISGAGCLTLVGFPFLAAAFHEQNLSDILLYLGLGFPWLVGAGWILANSVRSSRAYAAARRARVERQVLEVAAAHNGRVSPTMLTMEVPGITVARGKELLDRFASEGFCVLESDDHGRVYYLFAVGRGREADQPPLTADQWVDQMTAATSPPRRPARMRGDRSESSSESTDA